jgi:hypothetical protein
MGRSLRTGQQKLLLSVVLILRPLPRLHGAMRLEKGLALSSIRQVLGVHTGEIYGKVQYQVGRDHSGNARRVLEQSGEQSIEYEAGLSYLQVRNDHPH